MKLLDVEGTLPRLRNDRQKHIWLFVAFTLITILVDALLIYFSTDQYTLNAIISIFITAVYLGYLVFYFTVLRRRLVDYLSLYENCYLSELNEEKCELLHFNEEKKISNGIEYFVLEANVIENNKKIDKNFLCLEKFSIKKDQKVLLKTFGSVVVELEERK